MTAKASAIAAGTAAGLAGGVVSGALLQLMRVSTPDGTREPAMVFVAGALHSRSDAVGWLAYVVYAALIGAAFGWLLRRRELTEGAGLVWGGLYGTFWWIVSGLVILPAARGLAPLTPDAVDFARMAALPWLTGSLLAGLVLGAVYAAVARGTHGRRGAGTSSSRRAA